VRPFKQAMRAIRRTLRSAVAPAPCNRPTPSTEDFEAPSDLLVEVATKCDPGLRRQANEDAVRWLLPEPDSDCADKGGLLIVADGMGGTVGGATASRMAVEEVGRAYYDDDLALDEALRQAGLRIFEQALDQPDLEGMGTTCIALSLRNGHAFAAYVGDSRVYLAREGEIYRMTEDHSYVSEMVKAGLLTREEARSHEDRNIISRALGTRERVEISAWDRPFPLRAGDRLILCTDGLHDLVDDREILAAVERFSAARSCEWLVDLSCQRGGYDNITVAVVAVGRDQQERETSAVETREHGVHP